MLGQDLCPILEDAGYEVVETGRDELDITDKKAVNDFITDLKPEIVVHCAAYTNVDKAEEDLENARLLNSVGTENVAEAAAKNDAIMVYISTDYVFDGSKQTPYIPSDNPNPINNYGLTKLEGEETVKKHCTKFYIARTSWLYGHHGKNFVETMLSLAGKEELKVVNDQIGCPTWTVELCRAIVKLIADQKPYGIYHTCGSGSTTWYGFAKEIFKLANLDVNLIPCTTQDFPRDAKRQKYSVMDNSSICPDWGYSLCEYMKLRG